MRCWHPMGRRALKEHLHGSSFLVAMVPSVIMLRSPLQHVWMHKAVQFECTPLLCRRLFCSWIYGTLLACKAGVRLSGMVSVAGVLRRPNDTSCSGLANQSVRQLHGYADGQVPLDVNGGVKPCQWGGANQRKGS